MTRRVVLLTTSPRVAPGLLSWPAWSALRTGPVLTATAGHPQLPALAAAKVPVELVDPGTGPAGRAARAARRAAEAGHAVWLADPDGEPATAGALAAAAEGAADLELEVLAGAAELPGSRLLDAVAVVDRLRSPGGCPWDAAATHASLAPYLLEEAYETADALADGDLRHLREELGDVLVQVLLHARLAEEHPQPDRFGIDEVAGDLAAKLVRRHPHVFGTERAETPAEVEAAWQRRKQAEKGRRSVTEGVPLAQPALALAAQLQARGADVGVPAALLAAPGLTATLTALVGRAAADPDGAAADPRATPADRDGAAGDPEPAVGELLFAAVAAARAAGVDAEAALRARARRFRDRLAAAEHAALAAGAQPRELDEPGWVDHWAAAGSR